MAGKPPLRYANIETYSTLMNADVLVTCDFVHLLPHRPRSREARTALSVDTRATELCRRRGALSFGPVLLLGFPCLDRSGGKVDRCLVAKRAKTTNDCDSLVAQEALVAKFFSRVHIADVNLDKRDCNAT